MASLRRETKANYVVHDVVQAETTGESFMWEFWRRKWVGCILSRTSEINSLGVPRVYSSKISLRTPLRFL